MISSDLPPPRLDLRCYRHDIGVAWAWLAAARGEFGRVERIVSEREMRSQDGRSVSLGSSSAAERGLDPGAPFGVRLGGVGPRGQLRFHYPDLLLIGRRGEHVAIELELSAKGGRRLETILAGYGSEPRIAAVLYLADKPGIRREVRDSAARLGISDLIHVKPVAWPVPSPAARVRGRAAGRPGLAHATSPRAAAGRFDPREAPAR